MLKNESLNTRARNTHLKDLLRLGRNFVASFGGFSLTLVPRSKGNHRGCFSYLCSPHLTFVDLVIIIITRRIPIRIAARFSIAVHVLTLLGKGDSSEPTSEYMAGSIGTNPVIVRNVIGQLRRAGLVQTSQGVAGTRLTRRLADITLLDVYRAVEVDGELFSVHTNPNPDCTVGNHIQSTLEGVFGEAQRALEGRLAATTVADILSEILSRASA